jgi:hypothetical protein
MPTFNTAAFQRLCELQRQIFEMNEDTEDGETNGFYDEFPECCSRISFAPCGPFFHVDFYGNREEEFETFLQAISEPILAKSLYSLRIDGEDAGANGCRYLDMSPITMGFAVFPNLKKLEISPSPLHFHNGLTLLGESRGGEEECVHRLIHNMPNLFSLKIPCVPEFDFILAGHKNLQELTIYRGFEHYDFFKNLATASADRFPNLVLLEYWDCNPRMPQFPKGSLPTEQIPQFFRSAACPRLQWFLLGHLPLWPEQLEEMKKARPRTSITFQDICAATKLYPS